MTKKFIRLTLLLICAWQFIGCSTAPAPKILLGQTESSKLLAQYSDFAKSYNAYLLSERDKALIERWPNDLKIAVFFGTWCHDSQREVPRLLKILHANQAIALDLVALDYQKTDPLGLAKRNEIKYTPTFIVYQQGQELGRIIERPKRSLIEDINEMLL